MKGLIVPLTFMQSRSSVETCMISPGMARLVLSFTISGINLGSKGDSCQWQERVLQHVCSRSYIKLLLENVQGLNWCPTQRRKIRTLINNDRLARTVLVLSIFFRVLEPSAENLHWRSGGIGLWFQSEWGEILLPGSMQVYCIGSLQ